MKKKSKKTIYFLLTFSIMLLLTACKTNEKEQPKNLKTGFSEEKVTQEKENQRKEEKMTDSDLEEELKKYREERENSIKEANGLVEGGSPNESNYSFDRSGTFYGGQFDTRETTEAYAAARIYVTDTLGIKPVTKMTTYMCVDPRVLEIYQNEEKGVAAGYDNSNIFVCEYCGENGIWKYLILVREEKGGEWKVIHNGTDYKK